jgi:uncharacterized protein
MFGIGYVYYAEQNKENTMAGTTKGGRLAAEINKKKHGADFYSRIGKIGGKKSRNGGFAANRDLARQAGAKGGSISRRK